MKEIKTEQKASPSKKKTIIKNIVIWVLCLTVLMLAIFSKQIFNADLYAGSSNGFEAIGKWFQANAINFLKTLVLILIFWMIITLAKYITRSIGKKGHKVATVASLVNSVIKWVLIFVGLFLVLGFFGVDVSTLLASIGVVALIIGLGCQSLISDIVAGLFIVFDGAFEVGDVVVIDGYRGEVSEIGLKSTKILDAGGNIKLIANSSISEVINLSTDLSVAICECDISYGEDLRHVEALMASYLPKIKEKIPAIVDGPYYKGVSQLYRDGPLLKFVAKCKEEDVYQVTRDLNKEIFSMFDSINVDVPYPQYCVSKAKDSSEYMDASQEEKKVSKSFVKEQNQNSKDVEPVNGNQ
jgi:small-conductance mechanosensitive channel